MGSASVGHCLSTFVTLINYNRKKDLVNDTLNTFYSPSYGVGDIPPLYSVSLVSGTGKMQAKARVLYNCHA